MVMASEILGSAAVLFVSGTDNSRHSDRCSPSNGPVSAQVTPRPVRGIVTVDPKTLNP
jgi:hypothetical protein